MKKVLLFLLVLTCLVLTGCGPKISQIKIENIETCYDIFNITDYTFTIVYEDGTEEQKPFDLSYFSAEDQAKFNEIGEHQVTLKYENISKSFTVLLEERKAKSITPVQEKITVLVQEFEYEMVKFNVAFNDNTTEEIKLDKSMLSNEDIISLGKPGTYEITINYEEVQTTVEIELLPNEVAIESLKQDVVVYCLTKKVNDVYQSVFYALGNKDFSGLQFKLSAGNKVGYVKVLSKNSNLVINEETLVVTFVNSENIKGTVELFTLEFSSSQQYRNFTMDYDLDSKIVYINPSKEVQAINSFVFTFTR